MAKDNLLKLYENIINESVGKMTVGSGKNTTASPGELAGPTKEVQKGTGPGAADVDAPEEAPKKLSPTSKNVGKAAKPKKAVTENKETKMENKSFMELYKEVVTEADIESNNYNDDMGDFPPPSGAGEEELEGGMEEAEGDKFSQLADLFQQAAELFSSMASEHGAEGAEMGAEGEDMEFGEDESAMGEAVSEPEPKEFNPPISKLQAPRKLGDKGVKVKSGKASGNIKGKRTGELESGPSGTPVGGCNKVGGKGPAQTGKDSSMMED